ncbi:MAG: hypothetical protein FWE16_01620, partial [Firmicutes bacterium]|nr:hypothetical protein [Bacillota bacterium]
MKKIILTSCLMIMAIAFGLGGIGLLAQPGNSTVRAGGGNIGIQPLTPLPTFTADLPAHFTYTTTTTMATITGLHPDV